MDPDSSTAKKFPLYRQEKNVIPNSNIETYVALRLFIDNWRWAGVPFYLRGGKRLPKRVTEIAIVFKDAPGVLFQSTEQNDPNVLAIRIQPDEGIAMKINCKVPGPAAPSNQSKWIFATAPISAKALLKPMSGSSGIASSATAPCLPEPTKSSSPGTFSLRFSIIGRPT